MQAYCGTEAKEKGTYGLGGVLSSIASTEKYRCVLNRVYNFES